jgi:hypothetical protein
MYTPWLHDVNYDIDFLTPKNASWHKEGDATASTVTADDVIIIKLCR